jgi:type II secretory pathway pseudopilin PulG
MKSNKKGFTLVEVLLLIIAFSLIVGIGFYVYNANKEDSQASSDTNGKVTETDKQSVPQKKYLKIKELGVKVELSDDIADAYYYVNSTGYAYLSTRYFDTIKDFEGCTASAGVSGDGGGIAAVSSAKVGDDHFGEVWTEDQLKSFSDTKIGEVYWWIEPGNGPCWNVDNVAENSKDLQKFGDVKKAFVEAEITKL